MKKSELRQLIREELNELFLDDYYDEDSEKLIDCECGVWTGEECQHKDIPVEDMVTVKYLPKQFHNKSKNRDGFEYHIHPECAKKIDNYRDYWRFKILDWGNES